MLQVVADVRDTCSLRFECGRDLQRLFYGGMRGMRLVAQRIQKENVEAAQFLQRFGRDLAVIGQVSSRSETETDNRSFAVDYRHRLEARAKQFNGALDGKQIDQRQSAKLILRFENIAEHTAQKIACSRRRIKGQLTRLVTIGQRPQVVDSEDVVGVSVRIEDGIEVRDLFAQRLLAKVRRAVDHDVAGIVLRITVADQHGRASAPVVRILRTADSAVAADGGNSHRRAAAQYR